MIAPLEGKIHGKGIGPQGSLLVTEILSATIYRSAVVPG